MCKTFQGFRSHWHFWSIDFIILQVNKYGILGTTIICNMLSTLTLILLILKQYELILIINSILSQFQYQLNINFTNKISNKFQPLFYLYQKTYYVAFCVDKDGYLLLWDHILDFINVNGLDMWPFGTDFNALK